MIELNKWIEEGAVSVNRGLSPIVLQLDATSQVDTIHKLSLHIVWANNHPQLQAALVLN